MLLGLATAVVYGAADFTGGLATRRNTATAVVVLSQMVGFAGLLTVLPFLPRGLSGDALALGALSGAAGGAGLLLLYRGLSLGRMSVVAPITAVLAAAVPVLWGLLSGERPGAVPLLGVAVALGAIVLVSAAPEPALATPARGGGAPPGWAGPRIEAHGLAGGAVRTAPRPGLVEAVGAGLAFGLFFVVLDAVPDGAGLWPLVGARVSSVGLVGALAVVRGVPLRVAPGSLGLVALAGVLDMGANVLYLLATRAGLLSLVAVLASLYPASTVVLARIVLGERLTRPQAAGLACAGAGVVLIGLG